MLCTTPTNEHVSHGIIYKELQIKKEKITHNSALAIKETNLILFDVLSVLQVGDEESREQLIKTHYMARVGELTTQLQISDSKAVHFHSEVTSGVYVGDCSLQQTTASASLCLNEIINSSFAVLLNLNIVPCICI